MEVLKLSFTMFEAGYRKLIYKYLYYYLEGVVPLNPLSFREFHEGH